MFWKATGDKIDRSLRKFASYVLAFREDHKRFFKQSRNKTNLSFGGLQSSKLSSHTLILIFLHLPYSLLKKEINNSEIFVETWKGKSLNLF